VAAIKKNKTVTSAESEATAAVNYTRVAAETGNTDMAPNAAAGLFRNYDNLSPSQQKILDDAKKRYGNNIGSWTPMQAMAVCAAIAGNASGSIVTGTGETVTIELLSDDEIWRSFPSGKRPAVVTDLLTNWTFNADWAQDGNNHAHLWFKGKGVKPTQIGDWAKDARPIMVTVIDDYGNTRNIAYGMVPYPHIVNWQEEPNPDEGEMCIFGGSAWVGYGRDYGNEAAYGAFSGNYSVIVLRPPVNDP